MEELCKNDQDLEVVSSKRIYRVWVKKVLVDQDLRKRQNKLWDIPDRLLVEEGGDFLWYQIFFFNFAIQVMIKGEHPSLWGSKSLEGEDLWWDYKMKDAVWQTGCSKNITRSCEFGVLKF